MDILINWLIHEARKKKGLENLFPMNIETIVDKHNLKKNSRKRKYPDRRKYFCYYLVRVLKIEASLSKIGSYINRDHSSVHYYVKKAEEHLEKRDRDFLENNKELKKDLEIYFNHYGKQ